MTNEARLLIPTDDLECLERPRRDRDGFLSFDCQRVYAFGRLARCGPLFGEALRPRPFIFASYGSMKFICPSTGDFVLRRVPDRRPRRFVGVRRLLETVRIVSAAEWSR